MAININQHGYWDGEFAVSHHAHDSPLCEALTDFFKKENAENLADLGCGLGNYVAHFVENGIDATGYDGNPKTPELTSGRCKVLDLAEPVLFETPYDWILSIEVGEHLPPEYEDIYIHNLHNNNKRGIVTSWALEGQNGLGHFNERNNDYIKQKFLALGYTNDVEVENQLRESSSLWWFKNTIMVFRKSLPDNSNGVYINI
jgi:cyclopropane fatty-acyl-phospholipid synthase-like methyltransferase